MGGWVGWVGVRGDSSEGLSWGEGVSWEEGEWLGARKGEE